MLSIFKYTFKHEVKDDVLYVTYTGRIKRKQIDKIMNKIYALQYQHHTDKVLIDSLGANVHLELYEIEKMAKSHPPIFKRTQTAVVERAKKEGQYSLYQTITENQKINLRFFTDMKEAKEWLGIKS